MCLLIYAPQVHGQRILCGIFNKLKPLNIAIAHLLPQLVQ